MILLFAHLGYAYAGGRVSSASQDASTPSESLLFRFDSATIDSTYRTNTRTLVQWDSVLSYLIPTIDTLRIIGYASTDGPYSANERLSAKRAESVRRAILERHPDLDASRVSMVSAGEDWETLRRLVAEDDNIPHKDELERAILSKDDPDRLEARIKRIGNGTAASYIWSHYASLLRRVSIEFTLQAPEPPDCNVLTEPPCEPDSLAALTPISTPVLDTRPGAHADPFSGSAVESSEVQPSDIAAVGLREISPRTDNYRWALKNNLLYDGLLIPNIEAEYFINNRLSVSLELDAAWWHWTSAARNYELWLVSPEFRYWLRGDGSHRGFFGGVYAALGSYDLKFGRQGYWNKTLWSSGVSVGYYLPVKRSFGLEFTLAAGYMYTKYYKYTIFDPMGNHRVYDGTDQTTYFGPTKAKVSLVWRLGRSKQKGK